LDQLLVTIQYLLVELGKGFEQQNEISFYCHDLQLLAIIEMLHYKLLTISFFVVAFLFIVDSFLIFFMYKYSLVMDNCAMTFCMSSVFAVL